MTVEAHATVVSQPLDHIQRLYPKLRAAERRVADYILAHSDEVIHDTVTELAEKTQASESTIVRLAQRAGYKGYQALKIALARAVVDPNPTGILYEAISLDDDVSMVKRKVFSTNLMALTNSLDSVSDEQLVAAVDAVAKARRIEIYGLGASAAVALDAQHKFLKIGLPVVAVLDSNMQAMSASLLTEADVAIGISHSGALKDTVEALRLAAAAGATTICLTNHEKSPLANSAAIKLITAARPTVFQSEIMASRIAQLSVIDTLYVAVALRRYDTVEENLRKTSEATLSRRY